MSRTFKEFPPDALCPICNTNENKNCVLVPDILTKDGSICEAKVTHLDCILDNLFIQDNFMFLRLFEVGNES